MKNCVALLVCVWWLVSVQSFASVPYSPESKNPITTVADDNGQRYLCLALLNIIEGDDYGLDFIRNTAAKGANAVMITVRWDVVIKTPNSQPYWVQFDNQINLAKELGLKIFIRVHLQRYFTRVEGFWGDDAAARDESGRISVGMFSMAHQPTVNSSLAFVKQVTDRYKNAQTEGKILCVAVTTTPTQEAGYHFDNVDNNGNYYGTSYDFSEPMKVGYRQWLRGKYVEIRKLNEAWGADYSNFDGIQPSTGNQQSKSYSDWYVYRHLVLKKFLDAAARTIRSSDPSYKVINDFGAVYDGLSQHRATFGFKDLSQNVDGTKINDANDYPHLFGTDLLRSNMPANKWVMNEAFRDSQASQGSIQNMINQHFEGGCKLVNMVMSNPSDVVWFSPIIENIAQNWLKKPMQPIETKQKMTVKMSQWLAQGSGNSASEWNQKKNEGRVYIKMIEDLLGEVDASTNLPPVPSKTFGNMIAVATFPLSKLLDNDLFKDADQTTPLAYEMSGLPAGLSFDGKNIKGTPTQTGEFKVTIKAIDDLGASAESQFTITVKPAQKITLDLYSMSADRQTRTLARPIKNKGIYNQNTVDFLANFIATPDGEVKAVVMKLSGPIEQTQTETDAPYALFGDNGGELLKVGKYTLTVETYNSTETVPQNGLGREVFEFTIEQKKNNQPPVVNNNIPNQKVRMGGFIEYSISPHVFQDMDGSITNLTIRGLPTGITAREDGWYFSGISKDAATYVITVIATDNEGATASTQFNLVVFPPPVAPIVSKGIPDQAAVINQPFSYVVPLSNFTDPDGYIARLSVSGLPAGLSFQNGTISGRASALGTYIVGVKATDNDGLWVETRFRLTTKINNSNLFPVALAQLTNQQATVNKAFNYALPTPLFRDPEGSNITLTAINLPNGLTLNNGIIAGTPIVGGIFLIKLRGTDAPGDFTELSFTLTVQLANGNFPPTVLEPIPDQQATMGVAYSFEVPFSGFRDADGFIVSTYVRGLPPGLTYQGGVISGTPARAGDFTITVGVFDNQGAAGEDFFVLKIAAALPAIFDFTLMRAGDDATRRLLQTIKNDDKIVMTGLPAFINIFAQPKVPTDRVSFELKGPLNVSNTDGGAPFGLFDDYGGFSALPGVYELKATAFKDNKSLGEQTIRFEFVRNGRSGVNETIDATPEEEPWVAFPNPIDETITVTIPREYEPAQTSFSIADIQGKKWDINWLIWSGNRVELNLSPFGLAQGMYLLQIQNVAFPVKVIKIIKK